MSMFADLENLSKAFDSARAALRAGAKEAIASAFRNLFEAHPELHAVRWTQYTPYFNDGEACVFSVNEWEALVGEEGQAQLARMNEDGDGWRDLEESASAGMISAYAYGEEKSKHPELRERLRELFRVAGDEALEVAFDDHVEVIATRAGFTTTEYSHD